MAKKDETTIDELEGMQAPDGFDTVEQASEFLKLQIGDSFVGKFIRIEEVESQANGQLQCCWMVKDEERNLTMLLPEKATMRQFRSLLQPDTIFWIGCTGKAVSKTKNRSEYYTYSFALKK